MKLRCADDRKGRKNSQPTIASGGAATAKLSSRPVSMLLVRGHQILEERAQWEGQTVTGQRVGRHVLEQERLGLVRDVGEHVLAVDSGIPAVSFDDDPR